METPLTPSSGSLDAVTYFFVNSSVFILAIAVPFFILGLWLGRLTWGRYRRRFTESEDAVENLKIEVAQLKRRIAEQSARPIATFSHQSTPLSLAPTPMRATVFPEGNMLCVWTEPDWTPPAIRPQPNHAGTHGAPRSPSGRLRIGLLLLRNRHPLPAERATPYGRSPDGNR